MKRLHLFEFEDLESFPVWLRNYMTDFLQLICNTFDVYETIMPIIEKGLNKSGGQQIIDLASGGGGGWLKISERLKDKFPEHKILMTDYYPNTSAFEKAKQKSEHFDFYRGSVDARDVPPELKGMRTQFLSLHHFKPHDAKAILQNAVDSNSVIGVFEITERSLKGFMGVVFSPISVLLLTPLARPFSLMRLIFTYLIPLIPLFVLWDGIVSVLRTYTISEMEQMAKSINKHETYEWEIGKAIKGPGQILYLLGYPKDNV